MRYYAINKDCSKAYEFNSNYKLKTSMYDIYVYGDYWYIFDNIGNLEYHVRTYSDTGETPEIDYPPDGFVVEVEDALQ